MEANNTQNMEQQPTTQPADNGNQGSGKMFTQDEVNQIIKERLARERAKTTPQEPTEAEKREQTLNARESRLNCREYLHNNNYCAELLNILDTSDAKAFEKQADAISRLIKTQVPPAPLYDPASCGSGSPVGSGFKKTKHTPRQYPPFNNV